MRQRRIGGRGFLRRHACLRVRRGPGAINIRPGQSETASLARELLLAVEGMQKGQPTPMDGAKLPHEVVVADPTASMVTVPLVLLFAFDTAAAAASSPLHDAQQRLDQWRRLTRERYNAALERREYGRAAALLTTRMYWTSDVLTLALAVAALNKSGLQLSASAPHATPLLPSSLVRAPKLHAGPLAPAEFYVGMHAVSALTGLATMRWDEAIDDDPTAARCGPANVQVALGVLERTVERHEVPWAELASFGIGLHLAVALWQYFHFQSYKDVLARLKATGLAAEVLFLLFPVNIDPIGPLAGWAIGALWGSLCNARIAARPPPVQAYAARVQP